MQTNATPISTGRALRALAVAALLSIGIPGASVRAQEGGGQLIVPSCDASAYPAVTCVVTPLDVTGLPIAGLAPDAFTVTENRSVLPVESVEQTQDAERATSTLLLLDISGSLSGRFVDTLRAATAASLRSKPINERVALIALTGKIETPANADSIPLDEARESAFTTDANKAVLNKLQPLTASRSGTPLHDALNKALLLTSKEPLGARAIVVMSDGFDVSSTSEKIEFVIATARQLRIPIFSFGFGNTRDEEKLKKISVSTGGAYATGTDANAVSTAYRAIQDRLKTSYRVTFKLATPERIERKVELLARLPDGSQVNAVSVVVPEAPAVPVIEKVNFLSGNVEVKPDAVPEGELVIGPVIYAQAISRVEYQLDGGKPIVSDEQPFLLRLTVAQVPPGVHKLKVTVYGAEGKAEQVVSGDYTFTVLAPAPPTAVPVATAAPVPTAIPEPAPWYQTFTENPLFLVALAVGLFALLALAGLIAFVLSRRRNRNPGPVTDVIASPYISDTGTGTGFTGMVETGFDANASGQTGTQKQVPVAPVRDDVTRVIMHEAPPVAESPKTQILQLALGYLEVTGGANKGERVPIGLTGKSVIVIGRDADPAKGDLKITSAYVSRKHAEVKIDADGTITLTDLGSASGTKIDGVRLAANEARKIEPGIEIMIADVPVKVLRADAV